MSKKSCTCSRLIIMCGIKGRGQLMEYRRIMERAAVVYNRGALHILKLVFSFLLMRIISRM